MKESSPAGTWAVAVAAPGPAAAVASSRRSAMKITASTATSRIAPCNTRVGPSTASACSTAVAAGRRNLPADDDDGHERCDQSADRKQDLGAVTGSSGQERLNQYTGHGDTEDDEYR